MIGQQPNIFHLRTFSYAVYVPIAPLQRIKMGLQHRLGIYMGFDSPSIIRYLKPLTSDIFKAHFKDFHFNETIFPPLGGEKSLPEARCEITGNVSTLSYLDPYIPSTNTPTLIKVPVGQSVNTATNESKPHLKRGRPVSVKDKTPWKKKKSTRKTSCSLQRGYTHEIGHINN